MRLRNILERLPVRGAAIAAFAGCTALAIAPSEASARYYLSLNQAKRATRQSVTGTSWLKPSCRPRDGANTWRNRHKYVWHRWICDWRGGHTRDGVAGTCTGSLFVTGQRGGTPRIAPRRDVACEYPEPPPSDGSTPAEILAHATAFAQSVGQSHISEFTHTFNFSVNGCTMIQSDEARCTVWLYTSGGIYFDEAGQEIERVDFYRDLAFSTWIARGVYHDDATLFDYIDPAQTCYTRDRVTYVNCTAVRPGP